MAWDATMSIFGNALNALKRKPAKWFLKAAADVAAFLKGGKNK